jgi:hypothetical protein
MNNKYPIAILKGVIASIPLVGSFAVELLNVTIPDQRLNRVEKLLAKLESKVMDLDNEQLNPKFKSTVFIDVFEDVVYQSIRATSDERLEYLASVLNYGLRQEEIEHLQIKRILKILAEINDVEILILKSYQDQGYRYEEPCFNVFKSLDNLDEDEMMLENYNSNLVNLGLVGKHESIESRLFITKLGTMLLEKIGFEMNEDVIIGNPINPIDAINSAYKKLNEREKQIRKEIDLETKKSIKVIEDTIRRLRR